MIFYVTIECYQNCALQLMLRGFRKDANETEGSEEEDDSNFGSLIETSTKRPHQLVKKIMKKIEMIVSENGEIAESLVARAQKLRLERDSIREASKKDMLAINCYTARNWRQIQNSKF